MIKVGPLGGAVVYSEPGWNYSLLAAELRPGMIVSRGAIFAMIAQHRLRRRVEPLPVPMVEHLVAEFHPQPEEMSR